MGVVQIQLIVEKSRPSGYSIFQVGLGQCLDLKNSILQIWFRTRITADVVAQEKRLERVLGNLSSSSLSFLSRKLYEKAPSSEFIQWSWEAEEEADEKGIQG